MSASAPAGSASSITGSVSAVSTSATIDGNGESEVISHPAATSCIHVPTLEPMEAIQRLRNREFRKGLQGDVFTGSPGMPSEHTSPGKRGAMPTARNSALAEPVGNEPRHSNHRIIFVRAAGLDPHGRSHARGEQQDGD